MSYIRVPKVQEKLKKAESLFLPVVMMAPSGWGKTAAVENFYKRKASLVLHCREDGLEKKPEIRGIKQTIVIIEDAQWLREEEDYDYVRELLREGGRQILILTRGAFPKYLSREEQDYNFVRIPESDFAFGEDEVKKYFVDRGVEIDEEDVPKVTEASRGYPRAVFYYTNHMVGGVRFSDMICRMVWEDIYHLWDGMMYEQWTGEFREFALAVCQYEEFTVEMAVFLTGNQRIPDVLDYCRTVMKQIELKADGCYSIREETRGFFIWKQKLCWTEEMIMENYRKGASYYELHGDIGKALFFYQKAGARQRVKELLIRNAQTHPGTGHYIETKEYYLKLSEQEIKESPILMAGMCMLYDLIMQPEKSELWYQELVAFEKDRVNNRDLRREARVRMAYLDIALPHRGTKGILRIMKHVFDLIRKGDIVLPEMSVTGNMPSVMNGGLDFSDWSKSDTQIAKFMGAPLETILGKYGKGLVTISLAESGFEKGSMKPYEVMTRLTSGYEAALYGGKIEMCFVAAGIEVRQHLVEGQYRSAMRVAENFHKVAVDAKMVQLYDNLRAFETWLSLYTGAGNAMREYLNETQALSTSFTIIDRYRCMIRVRGLIAENRLSEAMELANFLSVYFERYERHFYGIEIELLKGIILFRMGDEHGEEHVKRALAKALEYHFIRIFSLEGAAALPLLRAVAEKGTAEQAFEGFLKEVLAETERIANIYPEYMKYVPKEEVTLTKREKEILALLCAGYTTEEICDRLGLKENALKKHRFNLYRKLGVASRAEAERKAVKLGLVVRK